MVPASLPGALDLRIIPTFSVAKDLVRLNPELEETTILLAFTRQFLKIQFRLAWDMVWTQGMPPNWDGPL